MKRFKFVFIALFVGIFLTTSCSSDSDDFWDGSGTELSIGEEVSIITEASFHNYKAHDELAEVECFNSEEKLKASDIYRTLAAVPPVDWTKQTLIIAMYFAPNVVYYKDCKVMKKGDKYSIGLYYYDTFMNAYGATGAFIVLNKPNVSKKDISIKCFGSLGMPEQ